MMPTPYNKQASIPHPQHKIVFSSRPTHGNQKERSTVKSACFVTTAPAMMFTVLVAVTLVVWIENEVSVSPAPIVTNDGTLATDEPPPGGSIPRPGSTAAKPTSVLTGTGSSRVTLPSTICPPVTVFGKS